MELSTADRRLLAALQREAYRGFYLRPRVLLRELAGGGLGRKVRAGLALLRPDFLSGRAIR